MARRRLGFQSILSILMRFAFAIVIALSVGCAFRRPVDLSATNEDELYTTTPLANATLYHHHWPGFPCYSIKLSGKSWQLIDTSAARVRWRKENTILSVFFTDNRLTHFSTVLAPGERVLRDFLGYELSYVRPSFSLHTSQPPRFANNGNGDWMQWAWQGLGGQVYDGEVAPADQRHVIANLWLEPWVMSFDWATERLYTINGPTPEMIDVLDSLEFDPACNG
jgi:hypothetical protein